MYVLPDSQFMYIDEIYTPDKQKQKRKRSQIVPNGILSQKIVTLGTTNCAKDYQSRRQSASLSVSDILGL